MLTDRVQYAKLLQAAARLTDAADVISRNPVAIQLRHLQTLLEASGNESSTIVFPLPIDVLQPLVRDVESRVALTAGADREHADEALTAARHALEAATAASEREERVR